MTTRSDVDRLSAANRGIVRMARNDLEALFAGMDLSDPEHVAGVLSDAVPALVREYGNLAAAVADDWYEEARIAAGAPGTYRAQLSDGADPAAVLGSTKTGLSGLFEGDGAKSLAFLSAAMQRHISYSTRDTIRRNVATDPARPRYARVPSGAKTCAWCEMLASRGFVYVTKKTAGQDPSDFHDDCDCQIVADFDAENAHIDGYDPDAMYERYREASMASDGTTKGAAAYMRRMHPEQYTDGVRAPVA